MKQTGTNIITIIFVLGINFLNPLEITKNIWLYCLLQTCWFMKAKAKGNTLLNLKQVGTKITAIIFVPVSMINEGWSKLNQCYAHEIFSGCNLLFLTFAAITNKTYGHTICFRVFGFWKLKQSGIYIIETIFVQSGKHHSGIRDQEQK